MSEDIGDKLKSWMHNAAANGAITLGEAIDSLLVQKRAGADDESLRVLKVFRNGAFEDAVRFIALAENFDKSSVLTAYNKAKLDILSKNPEVRSMGIGRLAAITPPADDCHPAEIPWHEDNCLMFKRHDDGIRKVISVHDADKLKMIDHVLELNCKKAQAIKEARGDIWQQQPKPNRTVVATLATGLLVTGIATQNADTLEAIADFVRVSVEALSWLVPSAEAATLGDGGLAQPATMTIEAVRATFGDGGLA
jgi:hypothetical protein